VGGGGGDADRTTKRIGDPAATYPERERDGSERERDASERERDGSVARASVSRFLLVGFKVAGRHRAEEPGRGPRSLRGPRLAPNALRWRRERAASVSPRRMQECRGFKFGGGIAGPAQPTGR
jgi:hypothetical protein